MTPPIPARLASPLAEPATPQRAFAWSRAGWSRWLAGVEGAPEFLAGLPDSVDRAGVAGTVRRELDAGRTGNAFVVAMVWGHGVSGYGAYRTAVVLSGHKQPLGIPADGEVVGRLAKAAELAAGTDRSESFRYLANEGRVPGLGPAFYTKWLYFSSATEGHHAASALPILDAVVQKFLWSDAGVKLRTGRTVDYATYVDLLTCWGNDSGRSAVQVEEAIFRIAR